jgi:hypothetical protein
MWERLVIVCLPHPPKNKEKRGGSVRERSSLSGNSRRGDGSTSSSSASSSSSLVRWVNEDGTPIVRYHPGRKLTKWERRKRHREKMMPACKSGVDETYRTIKK